MRAIRMSGSAHDAIAVTKRRCWEFDWVVELDIVRLHRMELGRNQCRIRTTDAEYDKCPKPFEYITGAARMQRPATQ